MHLLSVLLICCVSVYGFPERQAKIIGGSTTTIEQYPQITGLLYSYTGTDFSLGCGGTILNTRSILTAAHCVDSDSHLNWRFRTGSTYANSGGTVYSVQSIIMHGDYVDSTKDNDMALLRSTATISYSSVVQPAVIAGSLYYLGDDQEVWAAGWGTTDDGTLPENLYHVQLWTVNQSVCNSRYNEVERNITANMLCSGWLDVGGRDQCQGDSGSPLYHNGVVVGVCSWGAGCGMPRYPGINARVSRYTAWIQSNA